MSDKKVILVALACLGLAACGQRDYTPAAGVTAETIFAEACESCHGVTGTGKFGFLLKIADSDHPHPINEIAEKIIKGGHVMPAFPNIDQKSAEAVAQYLNSR